MARRDVVTEHTGMASLERILNLPLLRGAVTVHNPHPILSLRIVIARGRSSGIFITRRLGAEKTEENERK